MGSSPVSSSPKKKNLPQNLMPLATTGSGTRAVAVRDSPKLRRAGDSWAWRQPQGNRCHMLPGEGRALCWVGRPGSSSPQDCRLLVRVLTSWWRSWSPPTWGRLHENEQNRGVRHSLPMHRGWKHIQVFMVSGCSNKINLERVTEMAKVLGIHWVKRNDNHL